MVHEIVFAALSRLDGSPGDGIHLLWSPPRESGYSIGGFDIQRRQARPTKTRCHTLSAAELAQLHTQFQVLVPMARVGVRKSACPTALQASPTGVTDLVSRSIGFDALALGETENPLSIDGVVFELSDALGNPAPSATIVAPGDDRGLRIDQRLEITMPGGVFAARLLLPRDDTSAVVEAQAPDGSVHAATHRAPLGDDRVLVHLQAPAIARISLKSPRGGAVLLGLDLDLRESRLSPNTGPALAAVAGLAPAAPMPPAMSVLATHLVCLCYEIDLPRRQRVVRVVVRTNAVLAIATRDGKAVASHVLVQPEGVQTAEFSNGGIDQVLLYVFGAISGLTVCTDFPLNPETDEAEWRDAEVIAKGVDFPLVALNPTLGGPAGELALAKSRLLPGETIDEDRFANVATAMNQVAGNAAHDAPVLTTLLERDRVADPFVELRPWPFALSLTLDAAWRRVLGCGHLDRADGLEAGVAYDYRIVGRFRRRDAQERLFGLHDLPVGTALPSVFHLGSVQFRPQPGATVGFGLSASHGPLRRLGRKGVRLTAAAGEVGLTIGFDQPISRLALEIDPEAGQTLTYEASPSNFILGAGTTSFAAALPQQPRIDIIFPEPIDRLRLKGAGFFVGVRLIDHPPGTPAGDVVTQSAVVLGVRFEATPPPPPPLLVEAENLQQPLTGGDPAAATEQGYKEIGFRVRWAPPEDANLGPTPLPWPGDIGALPPTTAAGFHIERRRVDTGSPFEELDAQAAPTLVVGNRAAAPAPPPLRCGADLEALYTDVAGVDAPDDRLMDLEDVLVRAEDVRAPPGSVHQYRVFSIDAIGRRSVSARLGPETRLEKHRPPPHPVRPPDERPAIAPAGVRARFLQVVDPDLTDDDRAILADSTNAIVIDWGWSGRQRELDPFTSEFRVYYQPSPPDLVIGNFTSDAVASGSGFAMQATLNQPVAADAMRGTYLNAGGYPFKVVAHEAGSTVTVQLGQAVLKPAAIPSQGGFTVLARLDGTEMRPTRWDRRVAVVPITAESAYRFVIRDPVTLNAETPRFRVWVGVAAADGESYVPDERPAADPNGGRPGNESSIVAVAVSGRYLGRPDYTPPPPLAAVPELVTREPGGATVSVSLDLDALLAAIPVPGGHRVALERVAVNDLSPLLRAGTDDRISITFPDGSGTKYTLANAQDQADFLSQIRSGNPALIEGRFFLDLLNRFPAQLTGLWQGLGAPVAPSGEFVDTLPEKPERYFHRIRVADAAARLSASGAVLPQVVRTPSLRAPGAPEVTLADSDDETLSVAVRVRAAYDLDHLLVFALDDDSPPDPSAIAAAALLRLPNRRDLGVADGLRLRLTDGTILAPRAVAALLDAEIEPPDALMTIPLVLGHDRYASVWCVSLTRDRISSPASGPYLAHTGQAPLAVPNLAVTRQNDSDHAAWPSPGTGVQAALERSRDGGATWERASPWLPATATARVMPIPAGPRFYRLVLRRPQGAPVAGPPVEPVE